MTTGHDEVDVADLPPGEGGEATAVQPAAPPIGGAVDDGLDREPHEILGVGKDAPEPTIKGAFREMVK